MKSYIPFLLCLCCFLACNTTTEETATQPAETTTVSTKTNVTVRDTFDCELYGKAEKNTALWMADKEIFIRMSTDKFTTEQAEAINYNVLQIYDTKNCHLLYNGKLPLAKGTYHPYKLQTDLYEPINKIICTQGLDYVFCYHIDNRQNLLPLNAQVPVKKLQSLAPDAPRDLEIFGHYLFGWTEGLGFYVFNLTDNQQPKNELPASSYGTATESHPLYFLNVSGGKQLVIPSVENGKIKIKTVLNKAMPLGRRVVKAGTNGRYAIFRSNTGDQPVIVDLKEQKLLKLPSNVEKSTVALKKYLSGE